jgi:hypothetical protein
MMELPNITIVSDDINARLDTLLATGTNTHVGTLVMDFVTKERVAAIVETN